MKNPSGRANTADTAGSVAVFTTLMALSACAPVPYAHAGQGASASCGTVTGTLVPYATLVASYANIEPAFMRNGQPGG
jgi:hypothetical protein